MSYNLALLGKNISHSMSPILYKEIFREELNRYDLIDCKNTADIPDLDEIFSLYDGLNITSPYKEHFYNQVIIEDEEVKKIGAIKCIGKKLNQYYATNTDFTAMRRLLPKIAQSYTTILILGDGVMARMTKMVCIENKMPYLQWSRRNNPNEFKEMNLSSISDGNVLVVNCCAREYEFRHEIPAQTLFWDLNYNHKANSTHFSNKQNYLDGLNLLREQANDAAAFWSSLKI